MGKWPQYSERHDEYFEDYPPGCDEEDEGADPEKCFACGAEWPPTEMQRVGGTQYGPCCPQECQDCPKPPTKMLYGCECYCDEHPEGYDEDLIYETVRDSKDVLEGLE